MGWMKLNTDGARNGLNGVISIGGLIRDYDGRFVAGFCGCLGVGEVLKAELMAILTSLRFAWDRGVRKVIVESDCLNAVKFCNNGVGWNHRYIDLVENIKGWLKREWQVSIVHVWREGNRSADAFVRLGFKYEGGLRFFDVLPGEVGKVVWEDVIGVSGFRWV